MTAPTTDPVTAPAVPAPAPPAPAPAPAPVLPPAPPTVPPVIPPASAPNSPPDTGDGFPANTPVADMTPRQQASYWRAAARKHEDRVKSMSDYEQLKADQQKYQELVTASQTDHERAIAEAVRQGRTEALAEAGDRLAEAYVRVAASGRVGEDVVNTLLDNLNLSKLHSAGQVDAAKVNALIASIAPAAAPAQAPVADPATPGQPAAPAVPAPAPPRGPGDFGQGQPSQSPPSGLAAGREIARQRFAQTGTNSRAAAQ